MGLHSAPTIDDDTFHFHVEFYPPLRHGDKPKVLAGSESMAGVFIMDVLPEDSAKILIERLQNEYNISNIKVKKISENSFRVYKGPFYNLDSIKRDYSDIIKLNFENIEIIKL